MADQAHDREVVNGMSNAMRQFPAHVGLEAGWLRGAVSHAVDDPAIASKSFVRVFLKCPKNVAGRDACVGHFGLQPQISLPGVVIDHPGAQTLDQALKMFQHVPVMLADRRVERRPRNVRVRPITQLKQKTRPLKQNVLRGNNQLRGNHLRLHSRSEILKYFDWAKRVHASLLPITGISLRWSSRFAVEQTNTLSASTNSSPLSPWTSMPSTVKWLSMAPAITPMARSDPSQVNRGVRIRIAAISSTTPDPMRPHGSAPTFVKM